MEHALKAALLCIGLGSCVTTGTGTTATISTQVDSRIASVSAQLAKECTILAVAIELGNAFNKSAKVAKALVAAEAGRAQFCAAPPTNTNTAIATVANMAVAINLALSKS